MTWIISAFSDEAGSSSDEQIAALQKGGLTHLDLRSADGHTVTDLPLDMAKQIQAKLEKAGIRVNMYGSPIGKIDVTDDVNIDLSRLNHLGRLKDIFGCAAVRIFSYYNKTGLDKGEWHRQSIDRLKRLGDRAGKLGLVLYHENESDIFGDHPDDVLALAKLRDGRTFKLIYDFANYIRTGEPGWETWERFADITDCFHFKDQKRDGQHVPLGQGDTDAPKILADALRRGWTGPCSIEPHLTHSQAVLATGSSGTGSRALADLSPADSFQVAVQGTRELLDRIGAGYV